MLGAVDPSGVASLPYLKAAISTSDFIETSPIGLLLYDAEGIVVECNHAAAAFFELDLSDIVGHTIRDNRDIRLQYVDGATMPPNDVPLVVCLRERRAVVGAVVGMDVAGKPLRWIRTNCNLIEHDGVVEGALVTWLDCTAEIERNHILTLGNEVLHITSLVDDPSRLLQSLCDVLVVSGRYPLAWIATDRQDAEGGVEISHTAGEIDYLYDGIASTRDSEPNGRGLVGTAFRTGQIQVSNNMVPNPEFEFFRERAAQYGFWSTMAVPFTAARSHVLCVYDHHVGAFDDAMVNGIAEMTNTVAQRAQLLASLEEVRRSLDGTVAALGQATEERDPYTAGHQSRVGDLGAAIARSLQLEPEAVARIRLAGEVHDVGKIAIPAEILTRPGRLSQLEFDFVKQHCEVGAKILAKAALSPVIADVALQHHERMDGSGYPSGLRGDQIGLPARIIAVADVVEAMMNHRPYRPALDAAKALDEIERGKGTLFDTAVVDACIQLFEAGYHFKGFSPHLTGQSPLEPEAPTR
ncbi:MAG TPA: HD domain-containing phosphohydrolase [Acidimicrobiales bacterium]|nr:HD domain-containing phosphohydrolase [Acidimicrobiales bacterium]